jgi:ABC-type methionine transport system ATPase subunit
MSTVYDDVAFGPLNLGLPMDEVRSRVQKALETVGVLDLKGRPSHRLSSGQKRRVAIATVLSMSPDILVSELNIVAACFALFLILTHTTLKYLFTDSWIAVLAIVSVMK